MTDGTNISNMTETEECTVYDQKILAIDDDDLVRESLSIYLEDSGYEVIQANCGTLGLALFREHLPDLVLCDLRMPDMDGLTVLSHLSEENSEIPVIVISGAGLIQDVVEALRLGATDYLVKPIADLHVLEHAVSSALKSAKLERENRKYRNELEVANRELSQNLDVLQKDQEAGRQAQLQLLPNPDTVFNGYKFDHTIFPSLYLSGDFLDFFEIDDRYIGFYIADISGHGAASAFVTMMLKSLINHPLRRYRSGDDTCIIEPHTLCDYLNKEVISANLGKHLTLFYGVIDQQNHKLQYCNAGHYPRPILSMGGESHFLEEKGFPIGLFDWADFELSQLSLNAEFSLAMFSDGVLELEDHDIPLEERELRLIDLTKAGQADVASVVSELRLVSAQALPDDITIFFIKGPGK